jgi:hypothetical protein
MHPGDRSGVFARLERTNADQTALITHEPNVAFMLRFVSNVASRRWEIENALISRISGAAGKD